MSIPADGKLKVLVISPRPYGGGGVAHFVDVLTRHLGSGIEVESFLVGRRDDRLGSLFRPVLPVYDALRLAVRLLRRRHDVYHLNPSLLPLSVLRDGLFLIVLRIFRRPGLLVFFHGWNADFYQRIRNSRIWSALFRFAYGNASRILVLASAFKHEIEALGLPSGTVRVMTTMFEGNAFRQVSRSRNDAEVRVLFLSRLVAAKGVYQLLEAFRELSLSHSNCRLIMAGDGPEGQGARAWCLRHGLQERVRFPGYVKGNEKAQLLADSDIFVLPTSHGEGCPIALLEAMAAQLPVIVTAKGGIPDIVCPDVNGIVLESPASEAIRAALERLVNDSELRSVMGGKNKIDAWHRYEAAIVTARVESHYRDVARDDLRTSDLRDRS